VPCDSISIKIAVANVGLAIEAVPEQLELKKEIFLRTSAVGRQDLGRPKVSDPAVSNKEIADDDGFFDTGDIATIDEHGYMHITDRSNDVIKSGGSAQAKDCCLRP
jgi:acyl-CoA synthetase (AMP-forming)/AMP-acid ligase II